MLWCKLTPKEVRLRENNPQRGGSFFAWCSRTPNEVPLNESEPYKTSLFWVIEHQASSFQRI